MRHRRRQVIAVGLLAAAAGVTASSRAEAYCRTTTCGDTCLGPKPDCKTKDIPIFWPGGCVSYDLQQNASKWASLDEATTLVDGVFNTWGSVTCDGQPPSITFMNRGPIECGAREFNDGRKTEGGNANIIVFRDDVWPENDPSSTLALTTVTYSLSNGEIFDADIEINGSESPLSTDDAASPSAFDLASILTHEVGHFLGLAHSTEPCATDGSDCPTMNALYRPGSTAFRTLEADDNAGLCAIYPAGRMASDNRCIPQGGFSALCGSPATPSEGCALAGGSAGESGRPSWMGLGLGIALVLALLVGRRRVRGARDRRRSGTARNL